jgi:hypothetical protein
VAAPILALLVIAIAASRLWQSRSTRSIRPMLPFALLALVYFVLLPLNLLASASEIVHRTWEYTYLGVAVVGAAAFEPALAAGANKWLGWIHDRTRWLLAGPAVVGVALVLTMGNIPAGTQFESQFPGPYQFGSDSWGISPAGISMAKWVGANIPAGAGVITDRVSGELLTGYSRVRVPSLYQGSLFSLYLQPQDPSAALRAQLKAAGFSYFVLDGHLLTTAPARGVFATYYGPQSINFQALGRLHDSSFIQEIHRSGPYVIYRLDP